MISTDIPKSPIANLEAREALPLSLLNDYLDCARRAALKVVEGWRKARNKTDYALGPAGGVR